MMNEIKYPQKHSEAEIQSLLWYFLRKKKVDARLQVEGYNSLTNRKSCQLDLVVFKNKIPICLVECKSWSDSYMLNQRYRKAHNFKQIKKYQDYFGLPVLICGHMKWVTRIQSDILRLLHESSNE